jgi:gliding motility-associated-like protein
VNPILTAGVIAGNETTCANAATATITETTAATGGTGTYTYQWQSSATAGGPYTNVASVGTGATYNPGTLTATTYYQRITTSGTCGSVPSNEVTKTVTPNTVVGVTLNDPGQICVGTGLLFTAATTGGGSTPTYEWFINGTTPIGSNIGTLNFAAASGIITVRLTSSDQCNTGAVTSAPITLNVVAAVTPTVSIATLTNPNCAGSINTFTATANGQGTSPIYQWYVNGAAVGTNSATFSSSSLANGDQVSVALTSSLACLIGSNPFTSNTIVMDIRPIPSPVINETDQTICSPGSFTFTGTVGTGTTYQWMFNTQNISGATNASYTASQAGSYTLYEDNGVCDRISTPVTLSIIATPIAEAGSDIYIKEGDAGSLNGSGGANYSWSPATYLSSATVSNPSFTATETTTYILTVSDATNTCSDDDDVTVYVESPIVIPNIITTNGDGLNDTWQIENIESYKNAVIKIYNRWGNLVWESTGYPKNWDGSNYRNGEILPDGTYFYIIDLKSQIYDEPYTGYVQIVK